VYSELEREGILETRRGVGTFIGEPLPLTPRQRGDKQALREFATRVLQDTAARGFSRDEFIVIATVLFAATGALGWGLFHQTG
jgi:DNA-binding transcriptional regulator YhcF (GntR family)